MSGPPAQSMSDIVEEIRRAYAGVGIRLDQPASYGTYYRLLCAGCGRMLGNVGDRPLAAQAQEIVHAQPQNYASRPPARAGGHRPERQEAAPALSPGAS